MRIRTSVPIMVLTLFIARGAWAQGSSTTPVPPQVVTGFDNGFFIQSADGDYRLVFGLVAQVDGRFSLDDPTPIVNTFTLRKMRPTLTGRVGKYFDFRVMPDFGNGTTVVQDLYFDTRFARALRLRAGKDKTPVGYELLQGDAYLLFAERALASSLVPKRDVGFQAQGDIGTKASYSAGVFNGVPDGTSSTTDVDQNGGKDLAARIVVQPFRHGPTTTALSGLGFHLGGSTGTQSGTLPTFKTSVGQTYFSYATGATADGTRNRVSPAGFYYYKGLGAFAEYMRSAQQVTRAGVTHDVVNTGWETTASFVLTGEAASDRGVRVRKPFDPAKHQWGALQILARRSHLDVDELAFDTGLAAAGSSRRAHQTTIAANWYPNSFIKWYATYEHTEFHGGFSWRPKENVILFRAQIAF